VRQKRLLGVARIGGKHVTREELQSAIQDFWDEAFHCSKHEISDTSKAIALECMMDAAECKRCSILKRVETYTDTRTCVNCPLDGHCEFVVCKEKERHAI